MLNYTIEEKYHMLLDMSNSRKSFVTEIQDSYSLKQHQTEEECLEAVSMDGTLLQYVQNKTEAICLEAVRRDGRVLKYVNDEFLQ